MKQNRRIIHLATVVFIVMLVLAACGGGGGTSAGNSNPPNAAPIATAVGTPIGSAATATIGAQGGTLISPDGRMTLSIPAGALASDTVIGIQPITNYAHGGKGNAYRLTPDGQTFQTPVTLTFTYTDADLEGTVVQALGAVYQTSDGYWNWVKNPVRDTTAKTVTVSTTHFTDYADAAGFNLRPGQATVKVGGTMELYVKFCYPASIDDSAELAPLVLGLECSYPSAQGTLAPLSAVFQWSVAGTGSVSGGQFSATYTAPATKPASNTAVVSARIDNTKFGTLSLLSNITIIDTLTAYTGHLAFSLSNVNSNGNRFEYAGSANATFVRQQAGYFVVDGSTMSVTIDTLTSTESSRTCSLVAGTEVPLGSPSGNLSLLTAQSGTTYYFGVLAPRTVTMRCVRNSDGLVYTETATLLPRIGTWQGTNPVTYTTFPMTDGLPLSGSATATFTSTSSGVDTTATWNNTWSLAGQGQ